GKFLALGRGSDSRIQLVNVATGKDLGSFAGHRHLIRGLTFCHGGNLLASQSLDSTILVWDVAGAGKQLKRETVQLTPADLEALWSDLADADAARAYQAVRRLSAAPEQAVPLLQSRLQNPTVDKAQETRIAHLIDELDADNFAARESASKE